jgi:hypothetical protein
LSGVDLIGVVEARAKLSRSSPQTRLHCKVVISITPMGAGSGSGTVLKTHPSEKP